jgi:hypothetical protein
MSTLSEFLLARIAEDQEWAQEALDLSSGIGETREWRWVRLYGRGSHAFYVGAPDPARVLAECEAKRLIAAEALERLAVLTDGRGQPEQSYTLRALAAVYADHLDYRQEWKP